MNNNLNGKDELFTKLNTPAVDVYIKRKKNLKSIHIEHTNS